MTHRHTPGKPVKGVVKHTGIHIENTSAKTVKGVVKHTGTHRENPLNGDEKHPFNDLTHRHTPGKPVKWLVKHTGIHNGTQTHNFHKLFYTKDTPLINE